MPQHGLGQSKVDSPAMEVAHQIQASEITQRGPEGIAEKARLAAIFLPDQQQRHLTAVTPPCSESQVPQ